MPYHQLSNHKVRLCYRYERLRTFPVFSCGAYLSNFCSDVKIAARWGFNKLVLGIGKAKGLGVLLTGQAIGFLAMSTLQ